MESQKLLVNLHVINVDYVTKNAAKIGLAERTSRIRRTDSGAGLVEISERWTMLLIWILVNTFKYLIIKQK